MSDVLLQVGVKILIENERGEYLLLHRCGEKYADVEDKWDIPGGRIDAGSNLMENLAREVREETGLALTGTPQLIAAQDIMPSSSHHVVRLTYKGTAEGEIQLDPAEHTEYRWVPKQEMDTLQGLDGYLKEVLTSN